jgi:hypothetical protein
VLGVAQSPPDILGYLAGGTGRSQHLPTTLTAHPPPLAHQSKWLNSPDRDPPDQEAVATWLLQGDFNWLVCGRNVLNNKSDVLTGHVPTEQSPRNRTCCVKRPMIEFSARLSSRACLDKSSVLHEEHKEGVSHLKCFIVDAAAR